MAPSRLNEVYRPGTRGCWGVDGFGEGEGLGDGALRGAGIGVRGAGTGPGAQDSQWGPLQPESQAHDMLRICM